MIKKIFTNNKLKSCNITTTLKNLQILKINVKFIENFKNILINNNILMKKLI